MPVYFIQGSIGFTKIGTATNPAKRLKDLQCACPDRLTLRRVMEGGRTLEAALHRRFAGKRHRGEWYALTIEDIERADDPMWPPPPPPPRLALPPVPSPPTPAVSYNIPSMAEVLTWARELVPGFTPSPPREPPETTDELIARLRVVLADLREMCPDVPQL